MKSIVACVVCSLTVGFAVVTHAMYRPVCELSLNGPHAGSDIRRNFLLFLALSTICYFVSTN